MSYSQTLQPAPPSTGLTDAVRSRTPATVTFQSPSGWTQFKGRFLFGSGDPGFLSVEVICPAGTTDALPQPGQEMGVSFRRGSRKCVFTTCLARTARDAAGGASRAVLVLTWPEQVQELQRRLYHRTPVPHGRFIPVDLWLAEAGRDDDPSLPQRGKMLDLSAGGVSVELPREVRPRWRENDQLACSFAGPPNRSPIEVAARVTNYERRPDGLVRVGLQFMGLDTGERGRQTLEQISRVMQRLRRSSLEHN